MATELHWSRRAREDLLDIYVVIGLDNSVAAERIYDRLERRAKSLVDQPRLGPRRNDIRPAARMLVEGPYLILYETSPDTDVGPVESIEIVRIVDGRRDLHSLF
ncbi:MAG: type II toxin-antitoxin system RelE/ParE family toxin [Methylocystis sp.]|nr:type II toxin-antitoxin system RelE/ParE family toxin [Methylocystis sp.]